MACRQSTTNKPEAGHIHPKHKLSLALSPVFGRKGYYVMCRAVQGEFVTVWTGTQRRLEFRQPFWHSRTIEGLTALLTV
jgi:hypothetical protein